MGAQSRGGSNMSKLLTSLAVLALALALLTSQHSAYGAPACELQVPAGALSSQLEVRRLAMNHFTVHTRAGGAAGGCAPASAQPLGMLETRSSRFVHCWRT
jgi:hypothetical protein